MTTPDTSLNPQINQQNSRTMSYYSVKDVIPETIPEEDENKKSLEPAQYGQYDNFRIFPGFLI